MDLETLLHKVGPNKDVRDLSVGDCDAFTFMFHFYTLSTMVRCEFDFFFFSILNLNYFIRKIKRIHYKL